MVYSDTSWVKQALTILAIFLVVSGVFFWSQGINPFNSLKGLNLLGQVTNTTQINNSVMVTPFLQQVIDTIDVHNATPGSTDTFTRYQTTKKLLEILISEME